MKGSNKSRVKNLALALVAVIPVLYPGVALFGQSSPSAEEIIRRFDDNQIHETARIEATMVVHDRFGEKRTTMEIYQEGREQTLIEYTSREERGQKVLRTEDEIYLYYPDAVELIRLQGAALRQSMLGSDISYEDMTGNRTILDTYEVELLGEEQINGRRAFRLELTARERNVAYPRQLFWVDAERFVLLKSEMYSLSDRKLKEITTEAVEEIDGKWIPVEQRICDTLKRNSRTEFRVERIEVGIRLPRGVFSLEELSW
ncbi:MAG: outer membrane lipoprotein-sorting protein [Alkalispirochaetaceae bacterium]